MLHIKYITKLHRTTSSLFLISFPHSPISPATSTPDGFPPTSLNWSRKLPTGNYASIRVLKIYPFFFISHGSNYTPIGCYASLWLIFLKLANLPFHQKWLRRCGIGVRMRPKLEQETQLNSSVTRPECYIRSYLVKNAK